MQTFDSIETALAFVVKTLIPIGHGYIVNVVGPKEAEANKAATVQVVAQHMVYHDGNYGLTLNLPFDPSSGEFAHLVEFMGTSIRQLCDEYKSQGIPCFTIRFGTDVDAAARMVKFILSEVYGYKGETAFKCEVYDEGAGNSQPPPSEPNSGPGRARMIMLDKNVDANAEGKRAQAIEIVQKHFSDGLADLCDPHFLAQRYKEFLDRDDPIYVELLRGIKDEALAKTFVSYWTIAQTLATQSRFWLEDAVAEIITAQVKRFGRNATHVYSQRMLADGYWDRDVAVADLGEDYMEHLTGRRPWRPPMKGNALREVDGLVGEQERERVNKEQRKKQFLRRAWDEAADGKAAAKDLEHLQRIAKAVGGRAISDVSIQCNLLVIEPDQKDGKPHVFAFRFINPKTVASHAQRKQERVNLLRLYAYLVQEKLLRQPATIHVSVAELLPRLGSSFEQYDYYPDYFSPQTYWCSDQLWKFIGVPFDVVSAAISNVATNFREQLHDGLKFLLPDSKPPPGWGIERKRRDK